ncbi:AAA family ATPase [Exiguobacterium undae]|uniref:AAA family ATPase n=1 Tax=Exiguobacterium undae TaxID=169177 RepID=UPI00384E8EED
MKLEFIWFKKYKKLKNFQSNFGSKYEYKFEEGLKSIFVEENSNYIDDYFYEGNDKQLNISAIVGENGVGKSTILDFISDFIKNRLKNDEYIFIFSDSDEKKIIIHNFNNEVENLKIINDEKINIFEHEVMENEDLINVMPNTLFFSNIFDVRYLRKDEEELGDVSLYTDVSTNFLLWESNDNIVDFLNKEFEKQIYFIYDYMNELEIMGIIKKPDFLNVKLVEEDFDSELNNVDFIEESSIDLKGDLVSEYFGFLKKESIFNEQKLYEKILKAYLFMTSNLIEKKLQEEGERVVSITEIYDQYSFSMLEESKNIFEVNNEYSEKDILSYMPLYVKSYFLEFTVIDEKDVANIIKKLERISSEVKTFIEELIKVNFIYLDDDLNLTKESKNNIYISTSENIKSFIDLHRNVFKSHPIFNFSWTQLSSGEHGLLNLFGRIYSAVREIEIDDNKNSYLLLIDEGDLYFHPQWQKDWLYYFIQFINKLFKKNVQVITTTHSPLVLSDFPNSNVLFIGGNNAHSYNLEGSPRTLGANILELFSNSFFIKKGLVGRYGKNKINKFSRELISSSPQKVEKNKVKYQTFIDNIGEPLVRNHLIDILKGKISLINNTDVEDRINALEKEISLLKKMRSQND